MTIRSPLHLALSFVAALTLAACASTSSRVADPAHHARNSLDWQGTYMGPAADCGERCLGLLELKADGQYRLESHGPKQSRTLSQGLFHWNADGQSIYFGQQTDALWRVTENAITPPGQLAWSQVDVLQDALGQVLVQVASVTHQADGSVQLRALENWDRPTQVAGRSLRANYQLQCPTRSYRMNPVQYYQGLYGTDAAILTEPQHHSATDIALDANDLRMQQLFQIYCR